MSADESVALDALRALGIEVSLFHVRCLAAYRAVIAKDGLPPYTEHSTPRACAETRLKSDVEVGSIDVLHSVAQWEEAERTARRSRPWGQAPVRDRSPSDSRLMEAMDLPW